LLSPFDEVVRRDERTDGGIVLREMPSVLADNLYKILWYNGSYTELVYESELKRTGRNYKVDFTAPERRKHGKRSS
jgi:hypothetical protein